MNLNLFGFEIRLPRLVKKERRGADRVRTFEELYVDYRSIENTASGSGEARDISATGIRFVSSVKYPAGALLNLHLRFTPASTNVQSLEVKARVVRVYRLFRQKNYRMGCTFENLSGEVRQSLEQFIRWAKEREKKYLFFRWR